MQAFFVLAEEELCHKSAVKQEVFMHFDTDRIINILIVAALALVILIFLVFFARITDTSNPYRKAADMDDTYSPWQPWIRLR